MGIVEIEEDELYPLTDDGAADICAAIKTNILNTPRTKLTRDEIARCCKLAGSGGIPGPVHRYPVQTPGRHQHGQI